MILGSINLETGFNKIFSFRDCFLFVFLVQVVFSSIMIFLSDLFYKTEFGPKVELNG